MAGLFDISIPWSIARRPFRGAATLAYRAAFVSCFLGAAAPAAGAGEAVRLLVLGDSLTSGYGLPAGQAFPARLQRALAAAGRDVRVIDAGVAGDTTAGGLARLDWALADAPHAAIVALGANDGLRGLDPGATRANLDRILARLEAVGVEALLVGMLAPPNLGPEYGAAFDALFPALATRRGVAFYPFFLAGVAARPALNQADGIHPNARGVQVMVDRMTPHVLRLLDASRAAR